MKRLARMLAMWGLLAGPLAGMATPAVRAA
jgi:hypothetical protein